MTRIGIWARSLSTGRRATFDALGHALGVSFQNRAFPDDADLDGWVILGAEHEFLPNIDRVTKPCFVVPADDELIPLSGAAKLKFSQHDALVPLLRGREVTSDDAADARGLPPGLSALAPIAFKDATPVLAIDGRDNARRMYTSLLPPELNEGEPLFTQFSGQRIARLLPLVLFIQSLADDVSQAPPLQATFMFDDPNLHWTSYGFVDYSEMVRQASAGNYHVSFATIPLDAWFAHPPATAIFKTNAGRISLLCHGNDHVSNELGRRRSVESMQVLLRQALNRIGQMEARTGLQVARVMAPPHGACSETAISEMARTGFEAVCVSRGSLNFHNAGAEWTRTIGMRPCDIVSGLAVIPRFGLSLSNACRNDILVAAVLRQPIVPMTHHQAVADGYDVLNETAAFINSLGSVAWTNMQAISRSLYSLGHPDGHSVSVRMSSKRVSVAMRPGVSTVRVERPWLEDPSQETLWWRTTSDDGSWNVAREPGIIQITGSAMIDIASGSIGATGSDRHAGGPRRLAPVARRLLTEARDRALPSIHRIAGGRRPARLD